MENSAESNSHTESHTLSRRDILKKGAALVAGVAVGGLTARELSIRLQPDQEATPEVLNAPPEFIGFNTHLYAEAEVSQDLTLDVFKEDIDTLAKNGMNMIRFSIRPWEIAPNGSETDIQWNQDHLDVYKDAAKYAKEKGVQVLLVANTPGFAQSFDNEAYVEISREYFTTLAQEFEDSVYAIQLFNEPNIHHFRDYSPVSEDTTYGDEYATLIASIVPAIKEVNPALQLTVNTGGWPLNETLVTEWKSFFTSIAPNIDFISLDMYPDDNQTTIQQLDDWVQDFKNTFQKEVMISEIGLPTNAGRFTEADQGNYLSQSIQFLQKAGVLGILPYNYRDESRNPNTSEASFGIIHADGTPKESYISIMGALKPTGDEADQPQKMT